MARDDDAKRDRNQPAPEAQAAKPADTTRDIGKVIDERLTPLNESRERAEAWMKEINAQVAKLAGSAEDAERRRGALDQRLADLENRMQSLLTLTEMVSMHQNPFADQGAPPDRPTAPSTADAAKPEPAQPSAPADPTPVHPNDAGAEPATPTPPPQPEPTAAPASRGPAAPSGARVPADETRRRLTLLEWAGLLARGLDGPALGAFLGVYVEAGWIAPAEAGIVRNLTLQLKTQQGGDDAAEPDLEELHARTLVLLSHLDERPMPTRDAAAHLDTARDTVQGGWLRAAP